MSEWEMGALSEEGEKDVTIRLIADLEETMRQTGEIRIVRGPVEELLAMARDLLGVAFCAGVMVSGTFLLGRWG